MTFDGAIIKEQGITFGIFIIKSHVLDNSNDREDARQTFSTHFSGIPIILMAQNSRGIPTYHGRTDIVNFLVSISPSRIPWKRYTV